MFLSAVARPRWDDNGNLLFDGKIGIWPVARQIAAPRNSMYRPAGNLEWNDVTSNRPTYRELLIEKVLPAILEVSC
jgi:hypothetical protein